MISMKCGADYDYPSPADNPYGYGLEISLNEEQVEALGLDKNPPAAGSVLRITALVRVTRVTSESDPAEEVAEGESADDVDVRLSMQITDMQVDGSTARSDSELASLLYGG